MMLHGYVPDVVGRDMRERVAARSTLLLRKLVQMLCESAGSGTSTRRQFGRNRKFYPVDPGLRRAVVTASGADRGKQFECTAFLLLRQSSRTVHRWRRAPRGGSSGQDRACAGLVDRPEPAASPCDR